MKFSICATLASPVLLWSTTFCFKGMKLATTALTWLCSGPWLLSPIFSVNKSATNNWRKSWSLVSGRRLWENPELWKTSPLGNRRTKRENERKSLHSNYQSDLRAQNHRTCLWSLRLCIFRWKKRTRGTSWRPLSLENFPLSLKWEQGRPQRPDNGLKMRDRIDVGTPGQEAINQRAAIRLGMIWATRGDCDP